MYGVICEEQADAHGSEETKQGGRGGWATGWEGRRLGNIEDTSDLLNILRSPC